MFTPEQVKALEAPLFAKHIATRSQGGKNLSYIEAWHAIAEANRIFGFGNWERRLVRLDMIANWEDDKNRARVSYIATVEITVHTGDGQAIVRQGTGAGHGIDRDPGQAHESATKEAESDAMKRALMTFGNPFGLALYDKDQAQVSTVNQGRIDEFSEALYVVESGVALEELIREYAGDIIDLRRDDPEGWKALNDQVIVKRQQFKDARLKQAKEEGNG